MQKASRTHTYDFHSAQNAPQFTVRPGEVFEAETELCSGGWLTGEDVLWSPDKATALNPAVVVAVEGAEPGDALVVHIHDIIPDKLGYTGFCEGHNELASRVLPIDWGMNTRTVRIEDGFVRFDERLRLPIAPMIGTLGAAPAGPPVSNARGGRHGGNMDAPIVRAGARVTLPVAVKGALLHIGDVHALQGEGEVNGAGGVECRALARLSVRLVKQPPVMGCVRVEDAMYISAVACEGDMAECFEAAARELLNWACADYGMDAKAAYLLMGQVMEVSIAQMVNPTRTVVARLPKRILEVYL